MRSRRTTQEQVVDVARRRLERLSAELAAIRPEARDSPSLIGPDGSGERVDDPPESVFEIAVAEHRPQRAPERSADPARDPQGAPVGEPGREPRGEPVPEPRGESGREPGRHVRPPTSRLRLLGTWMQDRLPPSLQGRVELTPAHLVVVLALLACAGVFTLWWTKQADGSAASAAVDSGGPPSALATPAPGAGESGQPAGDAAATAGAAASTAGVTSATGSTASTAGAAPSGAAAPTGSIVVDVAGKVRRPGIATLPQGARVVDALHAAGGARRGVTLGTLNLARVLSDGEQIVVGAPTPAGVAASSAASGVTSGSTESSTSGSAAPTQMININTATEPELEELPGVGPVTAKAILDLRAQRGAFASVDELLDVSGIGDATLAKIAPYVTL